MRALPLLVTALAVAVILGVTVTALASGWTTATINLNTNANPVITYSISTGTYRRNVTFINYTALMLQSIKYDMEHRIPLNQTQLSFLAFLQALSTQPTSKPSIVNVTIVSTGAQPLGPYVSYEVFLINATLSSPAPSLLYYPITVYWALPLSFTFTGYLVALPGANFAFSYIIAIGGVTQPVSVYGYNSEFYEYTPTIGNLWEFGEGSSSASLVIGLNGVNYTITFTPYEGASMIYPSFPNTTVVNTSSFSGGIGVYSVPYVTPLSLCNQPYMLSAVCENAIRNFYVPLVAPGYRIVPFGIASPSGVVYTIIGNPVYLAPVVFNNMPVFLIYPTQPGSYVFLNNYLIPPGNMLIPQSSFIVVFANVTGPSVIPSELFSVSLPYGTCTTRSISGALKLNGTTPSGFLAQVDGNAFTTSVSSTFSAWVAGYDTDSPPFSGVLFACDDRGFWALTPATLNITLTDEYGYPVGYGIVTFGPNYFAWLVIVLAISAVGGGIYALVTKLRGGRGRGEVVIRL
jgi:hypothetical protein